MITRWTDLGRSISAFSELQRHMERLHYDLLRGGEGGGISASTWPAVDLFDAGQSLVLRAELPGMHQDQVELTLNQEVLTIAGHRKVDVPEGYHAHRRERPDLQFSRSFTLPSKVDPEKVKAEMKEGVLTVTLAKAAEAQPRQIAIKAS